MNILVVVHLFLRGVRLAAYRTLEELFVGMSSLNMISQVIEKSKTRTTFGAWMKLFGLPHVTF